MDKEKKVVRVDPIKEYKRLQDAQNFKTANNLYTQARVNEKMITGIQWDGINSKNLKHTTYNFISQIATIKNSSILANEISMQRTADALDEDNEKVQKAIKAFNLSDKRNWERVGMDAMNEQIVYDASIQGLGVSYWYWDSDIQTGNTHKVVGDIAGQTVDSVNFYVANAHEVNVQKQPWCKIVINMTVQELQDYAIKKGVPKEEAERIMPDEQEKTYNAWEKRDYDSSQPKEDQSAQLIINFEKRDGQVFKSESTTTIAIEEWKDIDMTLYPIAIFPYKIRKGFIYAEAEMTRYIENQKVANLQVSMRHLHAALMAIPKVLINENMTGSFNNAVGSVNKVKLPPGTNLNSAMSFVQPASMSIDVDKSVEDAIERTQQLAGVGATLQATARPENAAALLTQIKQANVPIESYKRRLYKYVEDVGAIWLEFYKTKYNMIRKLVDDDGEVIEFTGTDFADVYLNTATDVGPSTQWSEITSWQMLMDLWSAGIVTEANQIISRLPENAIKNQSELVEEMDDKATMEALTQFVFKDADPQMIELFNQASSEEKQEMLQIMQQQEQQQAQLTGGVI